jgi:hypothetical protein
MGRAGLLTTEGQLEAADVALKLLQYFDGRINNLGADTISRKDADPERGIDAHFRTVP